MKEWMPVNPCHPECPTKDGHCPPNSRFPCETRKEYDAAVDAQRKVIGYLIEHPEGTFPYTYIKQLNEMLKQMEAE
jgi:hypothetical protein